MSHPFVASPVSHFCATVNGPAALPDIEVKLMSYVVFNLTRYLTTLQQINYIHWLGICLSLGFMVKFIRPLTYPRLAEQGAPEIASRCWVRCTALVVMSAIDNKTGGRLDSVEYKGWCISARDEKRLFVGWDYGSIFSQQPGVLHSFCIQEVQMNPCPPPFKLLYMVPELSLK